MRKRNNTISYRRCVSGHNACTFLRYESFFEKLAFLDFGGFVSKDQSFQGVEWFLIAKIMT